MKNTEINVEMGDLDLDSMEWWQEMLMYIGQAALVLTPSIIGLVRNYLKQKGLIKSVDRLESDIVKKDVIAMNQEQRRDEMNEDIRKLGQVQIQYDENKQSLKDVQLEMDTTEMQNKLDNYLVQNQLDFYNKYSPQEYIQGLESNLQAFEKVGEIKRELPQILKGDIKNKEWFLNRIKDLYNGIKDNIVNFFNRIIANIEVLGKEFLDKIYTLVQSLPGELSDKIKGIIDDIKKLDENPLKVIDLDKVKEFNGLYDNVKKRIENFIPDFLKNEDNIIQWDINTNEVKINTKPIKEGLEKLGFTPENIQDYMDDIKENIEDFENFNYNQAGKITKIYKDALKQIPEDFIKGVKYDFGDGILQFQEVVKEHPELNKFSSEVIRQYNSKIQDFLKGQFTKIKDNLIKNIQKMGVSYLEDLKTVKDEQFQKTKEFLKKFIPEQQMFGVDTLEKFIKGDRDLLMGDIETKRKELYFSLKDNLKKFSNDLSKKITGDIDVKDIYSSFTDKGEILRHLHDIFSPYSNDSLLGPEVKDIINKSKQIYTETTNSLWSIAKQITESTPELKDNLNKLLKGEVKGLSKDVENVLRQSELGKLFIDIYNKPTNVITDIALDQIKNQQLNRYNQGDIFFNIQLPESDQFNFDFINATQQEFDAFKKVMTGKNVFDTLLKTIGDKEKLPQNLIDLYSNQNEQMKYLDRMYNRAQEIRQTLLQENANIDTQAKPSQIQSIQTLKDTWTQQIKKGVMPELNPFLEAAGVKNKAELIQKVKDTAKQGKMLFQDEIMLYNLHANDPELYLKFQRDESIGRQFLQSLKEEAGVVIDGLLDKADDIVRDAADGNFSKVGQTIKDTVKETLINEAKYLLQSKQMSWNEMNLVKQYLDSNLYPKMYYNLYSNDSIFQNQDNMSQYYYTRQKIQEIDNELINKLTPMNDNDSIIIDRQELQNMKKLFEYRGRGGGLYTERKRPYINRFNQIIDNLNNNDIQNNYKPYDQYLLDRDTRQQIKDVFNDYKQNFLIDYVRGLRNRVQTPQDLQKYILQYRKGLQLDKGHVYNPQQFILETNEKYGEQKLKKEIHEKLQQAHQQQIDEIKNPEIEESIRSQKADLLNSQINQERKILYEIIKNQRENYSDIIDRSLDNYLNKKQTDQQSINNVYTDAMKQQEKELMEGAIYSVLNDYLNLGQFIEPNKVSMYQVKETLIPKSKTKIDIPYDERLTEELEQQYNETKNQIQNKTSLEREEIIRNYQKQRDEILQKYSNNIETKPTIRDILVKQDRNFGDQSYDMKLNKLINSYLKKQENNQTKDRNQLYNNIKRQLNKKDLKYMDVVQYIIDQTNKEVTPQNIQNYNKILKTLYNEYYNGIDSIQNSNLYIKPFENRETNEQWSQRVFNEDIFHTKNDNPQYTSFNKTLSLEQGVPEKNYIIDRIIEQNRQGRKAYDYNKSLIENYQELSQDQMYNVIKDGIPKNLTQDKDYSDFVKWLVLDDKKLTKIWPKPRNQSRKIFKMIQDYREEQQKNQQRLMSQ